MEPDLIDNEYLEVTLPEGFEPISNDELQAFFRLKKAYPDMWGVRNGEKHIFLALVWKDSSDLLLKLVGEKFMVKRVEEVQSKVRGSNHDFKATDHFDAMVAGTKSSGFRCSYTAEGIPMEAEVQVFKRGKRCYTMYYATRAENAEENRALYEGIVGSLTLK